MLRHQCCEAGGADLVIYTRVEVTRQSKNSVLARAPLLVSYTDTVALKFISPPSASP